MSVGEFIWIAESDDYSDEGFLAKMVNSLTKHPTVSLAFSQSYYVDKDSKILFSGMNGIEELWKTNTFLNSKLALKQFVSHTQIVNASSVVFRRNKYDLINSKEYTDFKICGDWLFWIKLLEKGDLIHEREELNYFRQHSNNVRGTQSINCVEVLEQLKVYSYLKKNYKEVISEQERKKATERLKYILYVKICLHFNGQKVLKLPLALFRSSVEFPKLTILLPKLILSNLFRKVI